MKAAAFLSSAKEWAAARPRGIAFVVGLVLFGAGLGWAWAPLGLIGPGVVIMFASMFGGGRKE